MSTPSVDPAREQARQNNGRFGIQPLAESSQVDLVAPIPPMTLEAAGQEIELADQAVIEAKQRAEYASLVYAAIKVTERYPNARYLVFDSAEDEDWDVYVSHATDADGNSLVDFSDDFSSDWTRDLQVAATGLPRGAVTTVRSERYPTELNDLSEPYSVDIHDIFDAPADEDTPTVKPVTPARTSQQIRLDDARESRGQARFRLTGAVDAQMDPLGLREGDQIESPWGDRVITGDPVLNDDGSITFQTAGSEMTYPSGAPVKVRRLASDTDGASR